MFWNAVSDGDPTDVGNLIPASITTVGVGTPTLLGTQGMRLFTSVDLNAAVQLNWNVAGFDWSKDFVMSVTFNQNAGADGIQFGFGGSSTFNQGAETNNGCIAYSYNTFANPTQTSGFYISLLGGPQTTVQWRTNTRYVDAYIMSRIYMRTVGGRRYVWLRHGDYGAVESALNATAWTPGGDYIFVGARSGGQARWNLHFE